MSRFRLIDGFTLYYVNGEWVDNRNPERVDLTFSADSSGHPIDCFGERLSGTLEEEVADPGVAPGCTGL